MVLKNPFNLPTVPSVSLSGASDVPAIEEEKISNADDSADSDLGQACGYDSTPVPRFLGWTQVRAMLAKNFLAKRRTPTGTFFEIFSPVLIMLVLVSAYTLSEVVREEATQYDTLNASIPGPWLDLAAQALNLSTADDMQSQQRRQLHTTTSSSSSPLRDAMASHALNLLQDLGLDPIQSRRLQTKGVDATGNTKNTTTIGGSGFDFLDGSLDLVKSLLASPMPVPSLDQFVAASRGLSSLLGPDELPIVLQDSSLGRSWGNLLTLGTIHLSPNSSAVSKFQDYLSDNYPNAFEYLTLKVHDSEETALKYINKNLDNRTWALVDLSGHVSDEDISYKIRMNYTTLPNTNLIVKFVSSGLDTKYQRYYLSGYLTLQRTLNEFAMASINCDLSSTSSNIWSMPMPTAAYNQNAFFQAVGFLLGLTIAMAFMYPMSRSIKIMVEEKELRLKETLFILGVRPWAHFWSWLFTNLIVFFIITILVTLTLSSQILTHSNPVYLLVYIGLFSTATIGLCFVVAACFSKAKLAAIVGPMALFATLLPRYIFFGSNRYEAVPAKRWASLLPCTAFAFGADIIADYEYAEVGIQSWNAGEGDYSFDTVIGFLFFDTLLYIFLGWYLELVIPRQYGVARPWYFLVTPSYWKSMFCCFRTIPQASPGVPIGADVQSEDSANYETVTDPSWVPRVVIDDLVKRYNRKPGTPPAVNHLNLTLYESQITCLLGHNGAGKTSTISVLTGLFPPTSGDCYIYGHSIVNATNEARQSMGICPQHNVLFDGLTVTEHLAFFQRIKGIKPTKSGLRLSAEEIGLGDYLRTTSAALSGGNKRKLSLAIALCGDPQFLMLDEPTSGMDVASRRNCWDLLRRKREGRVTLLTTHFLDEASLLADRIAVMKDGQLQCCGSELFLKDRFGLGYNLTVVLADSGAHRTSQLSRIDDEADTMENGLNSLNSPDQLSLSSEDRIAAFLNGYIPETKLIRKSARELTFRFPLGSEERFPAVFDALEEERPVLSIGAYGISNTTLEEIFLQLAEMPHVDAEDDKGLIDYSHGETSTSDQFQSEEVTEDKFDDRPGPNSLEPTLSQDDLRHLNPLRQVALLYLKRFLIQRRDLKGAFFQIILPVLLCGLVLLVLTIDVPLAGPPIEMSMSLYRSGIDGFGAYTDVLVGGGATIDLGANTSNQSLIAEEFQSLSSVLNNTYPNSKFVNLESALSSSDVSQYLLDTYNDHDHNARYGAFVLQDSVNLTITVDWAELAESLGRLFNFTFASDALVDVGSILGVNGTLIEVNVTLDDIGKLLMNSSAGTNSSVMDIMAVMNGTQINLQNVDNGWNTSNDSFTIDSLYVKAERILVDLSSITMMLEGLVIDFMSTKFVHEGTFKLNITRLADGIERFLPSGMSSFALGIDSNASILHNSSSPHAVSAFNQAYMQYLFMQCTGNSSTSRLVAVNHPLPLTDQQTIDIKTVLSILASLFLLIPYCYIPGAFIVFMVKERVSKSKHLQLVSGVELTSYWISSYLWDLTLFFVLTMLIMLVFLIYGSESAVVFVGDSESFIATMLLTLGYGFSVLPFSYLLSRPFNNHSSAQIAVMGITFLCGFVAVNTYFILSSLESTKEIAEILRPIFRLWPPYNVGQGFIELSSAYWEREVLGSEKYPLDWDVAGKSLAIIYGLAIPYFLLLLLLEYSDDGGAGGPVGRILRTLRSSYCNMILRWHGVRKAPDGISLLLDDGLDELCQEDDDVVDERIFVEQNKEHLKDTASVLVVGMWKVFPPTVGFFGKTCGCIRGAFKLIFCCRMSRQHPVAVGDDDENDKSNLPKRAVRGVSTAIMEGETYGLLGVNGAGKTTMLGVLTGDIAPTGGEAYVAGHDVTGVTPGGVAAARKNIGFCPQVDPLLDLMSGRETLRMFGRLRGIPQNRLEATVGTLLDRLTLTPYADKVSESYSGGNKRKLSLGIALIGDPRVLFIDEASSGMDPSTRRKTWGLIEKAAETRSVVLTSHSMEEVEALCTRCGIMIKGQFVCLGSVQHLKSKYVDGYTIDIHCESGTPESEVQHVENTILTQTLPGSIIAERHGRFMRFNLCSVSSVGLGTTFRKLQELKESTSVANYSISQCSLEDVFIKLVKSGRAPDITPLVADQNAPSDTLTISEPTLYTAPIVAVDQQISASPPLVETPLSSAAMVEPESHLQVTLRPDEEKGETSTVEKEVSQSETGEREEN